MRACAPGLTVRVLPAPDLALRTAAEGLGPEDCLCVAGSIYLAGIARRVLRDPQTLRAVRAGPCLTY